MILSYYDNSSRVIRINAVNQTGEFRGNIQLVVGYINKVRERELLTLNLVAVETVSCLVSLAAPRPCVFYDAVLK